MRVTAFDVKRMVKVLPFYLFTFLLLSVVSCSEEDTTVEEFPNWQATNEAYFQQLVATTKAKVAEGDTQWELLPAYTKPDKDYTYQYQDYVVVQKLATGTGTTSPLMTDVVKVSYVGNLLPSAQTYKETGMEFDRSYSGDYDPAVSTPASLTVSSLIDGFTTVLLHMHRGDHWKAYIPYQLGYGTTASGSIPAYSTLIFDLWLEDF